MFYEMCDAATIPSITVENSTFSELYIFEKFACIFAMNFACWEEAICNSSASIKGLTLAPGYIFGQLIHVDENKLIQFFILDEARWLLAFRSPR